ncbi:MAG: hypothetical protein A2017_02265 [Lentisphaerae bacterium GWF2_44_16]|nr:MAG: hypothetical protein A2017_02265 [Lentisphaerae bacterium GWF2_44_16]
MTVNSICRFCIFTGATLWLLCSSILMASDKIEIVKDKTPMADIIIMENAPGSIRLAAKELQEYIKKISGAELTVGDKENSGKKYHIYVGESPFTKKLNFSTTDLKIDGFKILSGNNWLILAGRDYLGKPIFFPPGNNSREAQKDLLKKWQNFAGEKWNFSSLVSYKFYNKELDLGTTGETGTLFAVYDFLEMLGVRWYMPYEDGTVVPEMKDIHIAENLNIRKEPVFELRDFTFIYPHEDKEGLLWYKRLKLGRPYIFWCCHSINLVTQFQKETHPEYFATINGKLDLDGCKGFGRPRLGSPELKQAMIKYAQMFFKAYPEQQFFSVFPPDSFSMMCEKDVAAGMETPERGNRGKMSDYIWGFVNDVAKEIEKSNPGKYVTCGAYSGAFLPPLKIDKLNKNVSVTLCRTLIDGWNPESLKERKDVVEEWLKKISSGSFYIWDYYLYHRDKDMPGVPVVFLKLMQDEARELAGKCKGKFIEATRSQGKIAYPGLNHLTYYIQSKLYWDVNLDMNKLLDEYCEKFHGPAKDEMKKFFTTAEEIWMRPEARKISKVGGFLKKEDVKKYFEILDAALKKAGENNVYARRISMIKKECRPMKEFFDKLERTGGNIKAMHISEKPAINGILDEKAWNENVITYKMKTVDKSKQPENETIVKLRWLMPARGLLIGVECKDRNMKNIKAQNNKKDSSDIFKDDVIEIYLETQNVSYYKIVINPNGAVYDECTGYGEGGLDWDSKAEVAITRNEDSWYAEIFIPLSSMKGNVPSEAYPWGINICRTSSGEKETELSAICPTGKKQFLDLQKMGNMFLK